MSRCTVTPMTSWMKKPSAWPNLSDFCLGGGLSLLNGLLRLLLLNPLIDMGQDSNGFAYKKYANGEGEWRKKITFTTPEWSGQPHLYYCTVDVHEVPENMEEHGAIQFIVESASGAVAVTSLITLYPNHIRLELARFYGGTDAREVTGYLIITGKWK